jgi:hypothetical protein
MARAFSASPVEGGYPCSSIAILLESLENSGSFVYPRGSFRSSISALTNENSAIGIARGSRIGGWSRFALWQLWTMLAQVTVRGVAQTKA